MYKKEIRKGLSVLAPAQIWAVDLDTLNMSDADWCVSGQLYGDYDRGLEALFSETENDDDEGGKTWQARTWTQQHEQAIRHGFTLRSSHLSWESSTRAFARLTDEWKQEIQIWRKNRAEYTKKALLEQ
jgi:hypothetical protein